MAASGREGGTVLPAQTAEAAGRVVAITGPDEGGAGLAGEGGQAGVGGEFAAVGEGRAVADLGEDAGAGRWPDPWLDASSSPERVGQGRLLDLGGLGVAAGAHAVQFGGQLGDDTADGGLLGPPARTVSQGAWPGLAAGRGPAGPGRGQR